MPRFRTPTPADAAMLAELGRSSFTDAFGHLYAADDLAQFLEQTYAVPVLERQLGDPALLFRLAEEDGEAIGYCKLGLTLSLDYDPGDRRIMEIKQLYLRGQRAGGGVGAALIAWALDEGRARGYDAVLLSVWSGNEGGQRFYARHGFAKWGDTIFRVGSQVDQEYLFGRDL